MKSIRIMTKILYWIVMAVLAIVLCFNLGILIARLTTGEEMPLVFGYGNAIVITGSMEPTIGINDMVITHSQESYRIGDIVTYKDENGTTLVTHRIKAVADDGEGFITKGDANNANDPDVLSYDRIVGRVVYIVPNIGKLMVFLKSPMGLVFILFAGVIVFLAPSLFEGLSKKNKTDDCDDENDTQKSIEQLEAETKRLRAQLDEYDAAQSVEKESPDDDRGGTQE